VSGDKDNIMKVMATKRHCFACNISWNFVFNCPYCRSKLYEMSADEGPLRVTDNGAETKS
jgi:hypothetical protein